MKLALLYFPFGSLQTAEENICLLAAKCSDTFTSESVDLSAFFLRGMIQKVVDFIFIKHSYTTAICWSGAFGHLEYFRGRFCL